mgnify:FL=1
MFDIRIERLLNKDINTVFERLADHAGYTQYKGIQDAKLLEPGSDEPNGLGALRYVDLGSVNFDERITAFERPYRMDYLIERSSPLPFRHEVGSIKLKQEGEGTRVIWESKGTITVPVIGKLVFDRVFQKKGSVGFASLLKQIEGS